MYTMVANHPDVDVVAQVNLRPRQNISILKLVPKTFKTRAHSQKKTKQDDYVMLVDVKSSSTSSDKLSSTTISDSPSEEVGQYKH